MSSAVRDVWVKLDGVLAEQGEIASTWAIGQPTPHAAEVLALAATGGGKVYVYGTPCYTPRGIRAVQRWLAGNDLSKYVEWVMYDQTPPDGVEVINQWPMNTPNSSDPADSPPTETSTPPDAIKP